MHAFLPNLLVFVVGQATAWFHLRSGRWVVGGLLSAALWGLADWALVAKNAFGATDGELFVPLVGMQIIAVGAASWLCFRLWWRRRSRTARERPELFAEGMAAYLGGDLDRAAAIFRRLVRGDPWDAAAWIAAGNVARRGRDPSRAERCWWRGLGVDRSKTFADLVAHQRQLEAGKLPAASAREPARPPTTTAHTGD